MDWKWNGGWKMNWFLINIYSVSPATKVRKEKKNHQVYIRREVLLKVAPEHHLSHASYPLSNFVWVFPSNSESTNDYPSSLKLLVHKIMYCNAFSNLIRFQCDKQVASATATFVMLFSSSLSVVEFYLLKRFPIPYGNFLIYCPYPSLFTFLFFIFIYWWFSNF